MKIDTRAGSRDLIPILAELGVPVDSGILPAGDVEIIGNGPGGRPVCVGVEYKSIPDAVACMKSGRFAEQLRGMKANYEVCWLLVEGRFGPMDEHATVRRGTKTYPLHASWQGFMGWLLTMCQSAGMLLWRTESKEETARWLRSLELWWTAKDWEDHRAHLDWYTPEVGVNPFSPPTLAQRVAGVLPGIGPTRSRLVAEHFRSAKKIFLASAEDWSYIKGMGKKSIRNVLSAIEREE